MIPSTKENRQRTAENQEDDAGPSRDNSSNLNVSLHYDVLRIIFKHLKVRDLSHSLMVCRNWKTAAIDEYSSRGPFSIWVQLKVISDSLPRHLVPQLDYGDLPIKPHFGLILIISPYIHQFYHKYPSSSKIIQLNVYEIIQDESTTRGLSPNTESPYVPTRAFFTFLPKIPHAHVHMFEIEQNVTFVARLNQALHVLPILNDHVSTCCIIFHSIVKFYDIDNVFQLLNLWKHKISSLWGGQTYYVSSIDTYNCDSKTGFVIFIFGKIKTWSIMIDSNLNTVELIVKKLLAFKKHVNLRKHSVGFMFSNCNRSNTLRNENVIELRIFKKLFPKVPLVGCAGTYVFGKDLLYLEEEIVEGNILLSSCGTNFTIITYG